MKKSAFSMLLCLTLMIAAPAVFAAEAPAELTYAIEINGVICGYADVIYSEKTVDGANHLDIRQNLFMMLTVLGANVNTSIDATCDVDPATERFRWMTSHIDQGDVKIDVKITVDGDTALCYSSLTGGTTRVAIPDGTILDNPLYSYHLMRDFVEGGVTEKTYNLFNVQEFSIQENTCKRVGNETLELAGKVYETIIIDTVNNVTGMSVRSWMDRASGISVKVKFMDNRFVYLADPSVKKQMELANLDEDIVTKTNESIPDVTGISYMKVRAKIQPAGLWLESADLSVPGQKFEGTVTENLIEGVFEVEHPRYDGTNAPPYPADFSKNKDLESYLHPSVFIQSDDPVLKDKATALADGSGDSWEAACRLSRWVAENIGYAIPGGGTARKVYDLRAGECGGHSFLLATFCRSVGIPARVVWGCMYIPNFGGSFGQHAWNEIYMGEAGWIPVDATAMETDFLDSGHIRVGEYQSMSTVLNAKEMEILTYRTATSASVEDATAKFDLYDPYIGEYQHARGGPRFKVVIENGALAVDIPDKMVLGFNDPDENGIWRCKMSNAIYCTFNRDKRGKVEEMIFHEVVRMPRRSDPESIDPEVPVDLRPLLGGYYYAAVQAEFEILWEKKRPALYDPLQKESIPLKPGENESTWTDRNDRFTLTFSADANGAVSMLELDSANRFRRK